MSSHCEVWNRVGENFVGCLKSDKDSHYFVAMGPFDMIEQEK